MRTSTFIILSACLTYLVVAMPHRVMGDELKNLVANHLAGDWSVREDVTGILGGQEAGELGKTVTFKDDASIQSKLKGDVAEFIKAHRVFMSGLMTRAGKDVPFVLTQVEGSPYVFWFRERNGDPMGDSESFFISIAVGKTKDKDLLFIGGDFDNQAFLAYGRAKATK